MPIRWEPVPGIADLRHPCDRVGLGLGEGWSSRGRDATGTAELTGPQIANAIAAPLNLVVIALSLREILIRRSRDRVALAAG
ncbi:hypothetical protein ACWEQ1_27555 [Streptomyces nodosus]